MNSQPNPLPDFHHPMTFESRGVAMPFTTPMLDGMRLRRSERDGVELVLSNPSGSRGVYVLHWSGVRGLCIPTVHDMLLYQRCARLTRIDPASIREAALEIARDGHAGREAAAAAETAIEHDCSERLLAHFLLMAGLVEQAHSNGPKIASSPNGRAGLYRRATAVLHRIAPSLGCPPEHLSNGLTMIGDMFAPLGVANGDRDARIPRLLTRLDDTRTDMARWLDADAGNDVGGLGRAIAAAMRRTCEATARVLKITRSALIELGTVLKRWVTDPDGLRAQAQRCDLLLDGWERVGLLWLAAGTTASRRAALLEMAPLVPVLPREVLEWAGVAISPETTQQTCRVTSNEDAWRTGGPAFALIERNEKLLARSL